MEASASERNGCRQSPSRSRNRTAAINTKPAVSSTASCPSRTGMAGHAAAAEDRIVDVNPVGRGRRARTRPVQWTVAGRSKTWTVRRARAARHRRAGPAELRRDGHQTGSTLTVVRLPPRSASARRTAHAGAASRRRSPYAATQAASDRRPASRPAPARCPDQVALAVAWPAFQVDGTTA